MLARVLVVVEIDGIQSRFFLFRNFVLLFFCVFFPRTPEKCWENVNTPGRVDVKLAAARGRALAIRHTTYPPQHPPTPHHTTPRERDKHART